MQAFLESFKTPEEVHGYCRAKGVKGVPAKCSQCVIAELLKAEYPERFENGESVEVLRFSGVTRFSRLGKPNEYFETPDVIRRFLLKFDEGQYPDLVKQESVNA